jgi:glycosyltransferase involved in cell wall biosynthesis
MSNTNERPSISVFFPAYNDARSIGKLVEDTLEILSQLTDAYEVIVVNDGSADETQDVLDELKLKYDAVRVVRHETNKGYGGALQSGFRAAANELVFYTDGDGQYDVRDLLKLFPLLTDDVDVVNGYKMERSDKMNRKIIGTFYNRLAHFLFSLPIRDVDCDFRLIRRTILGKISLYSSSGSICVELVYKLWRAGARFAETGVNHHARQYGKSQFFTVRRVSKTLLDFFFLWLKLVVLRKD